MIADNHIIIIRKMEKANEFLPELGDYRKLRVFQVTTIIYDITRYFANNVFIAGDRTIDQMVQAARSGRQNIAEGSAAATTSKETEIKLTNVAKASLQELLLDYEDYLRQHDLNQTILPDPQRSEELCGGNQEAQSRDSSKHCHCLDSSGGLHVGASLGPSEKEIFGRGWY